MAQQLTPEGVRVADHLYQLKRRRRRGNPVEGLNRTSIVKEGQYSDGFAVFTGLAASPLIAPPNAVREAPLTVTFAIEVDNVQPRGNCLEFGGSGAEQFRCAFLRSTQDPAINETALAVAAGNATSNTNPDGVHGFYENAAFRTVGSRWRVVVACLPGTGQLQAWVNGRRVIDVQSTNESFSNGMWSNAGNGSSYTSVGGAGRFVISSGPTHFFPAEAVSFYYGQLPRTFRVQR